MVKKAKPPSGQPMNSPPGGLNWLLIIGLVLMLVFVVQAFTHKGQRDIPYSEARQLILDGEIERVEVSPSLMVLHPTESAVDEEGEPLPLLRSVRVEGDDGLVELLEASGVGYSGFHDASCGGGGLMGLFLFPLLMVMLFWMFMLRRVGPGAQAANFGKMKAKLYSEEKIKVRFSDVAGVDEAKEELQEVVDFLRQPERFRKLGAKIPRGVLMVGPPGTGKTLLGKAVAGEAGVAFFSLSGSDFVEMFVGVGAARVRDLFEQAKEVAPCIIFLDELDAIGKARGGANQLGGNDEREQTLNALLVGMDGFDERDGVIVLAATNRPETLDPALLRPGRFDRQVLVDRPDRAGRRAILNIHAAKIVMSGDVNLDEVAEQTTGFAGADLANVVNEAALLAARRSAESVSMSDFHRAIERVIAGLEKKNRRMIPSEKEAVAYHENGHAIVGRALPTSDPVRRISIVPRGMGALGYTLQVPLEDRYLMTERQLFDRICGLLGGRAAEQVAFGEVSTGAQNDLQRVTDIARRMMTEFGMSERLGLVALAKSQRPFLLEDGAGGGGYSDATAELLDQEVRAIVDQAFEHALAILRHNRALLDHMSIELLKTEVLEGAPLDALLSEVEMLPADKAWKEAQEQAAASRPTFQLISELTHSGSFSGSVPAVPPPVSSDSGQDA